MDQSVLVYSLTALAISLPCFSPPLIITRPSEKTYRSRKFLKDPLSLPYLADAASIDLSVIIPAYNETSRLPSMLETTLDHLNTTSIRQARTYELIIIDDSSKDDTPALARLLERGNMRWRGGRWAWRDESLWVWIDGTHLWTDVIHQWTDAIYHGQTQFTMDRREPLTKDFLIT
ncbi:hypothetical protein C8R48DRAFT_762563 [Suillus tomentosus]|nr:hypothetical protein C8R48DRAFT_762563 [Suillus tomentosus]